MQEYPPICPLCKGGLKIDNRLAPKGRVFVCANKICRSGRPVRKQWQKVGRKVIYKRGATMAEIDLAKATEGLDYGDETDP